MATSRPIFTTETRDGKTHSVPFEHNILFLFSGLFDGQPFVDGVYGGITGRELRDHGYGIAIVITRRNERGYKTWAFPRSWEFRPWNCDYRGRRYEFAIYHPDDTKANKGWPAPGLWITPREYDTFPIYRVPRDYRPRYYRPCQPQ